MLTAVAPQPQLLAYVAQVHTFKVVLRDRLDQENIYTVKADTDRFCNLVAIVRAMYPGQAIVDSWEV